MKTITIKIDNPDQQGDFPLRLHLETEQGRELQAEETIPQSLRLDGQTLDPKQFREDLLGDNENSEDFEAFGEHLFQLINQGKVGQRWREFMDKPEAVRTLLEVKPPDLVELPWELVCFETNRYVVDPIKPFLRAVNYRQQASSARHSWMLRLMIIVGAKPDDSKVAAEEECRQIEEALRSISRTIDVEILRRPTRSKLIKEYENFLPDILHFIGHGVERSGKAALRFDPVPPEARWYWAEGDIFNDLRVVVGDEQKTIRWKPSFVFLNACRTGAQPGETTYQPGKRGWSVGEVFRKLGVPATLTMQGDVQGKHAGLLAGELYKELAAGSTLDVALARARGVVMQQEGIGIDHREWALPCLTVSLPPEEILSLRPKITAQEEKLKIENCEQFGEVLAEFVDRKPDRRNFVHGFYPIKKLAEGNVLRHLMVVHGESKIGKSWVVSWCMEAFAWQGHNMRYVEVAGENGAEWLDVLLQIRSGDEKKAEKGSPIHEPLQSEAFHQFNWALLHRLQGNTPPTWNGERPEPPKKDRPLGKYNRTEKFEEDTFASFRDALEAAASGQPLILVLDHFTHGTKELSPEHMLKYLRPELIEHVAKGLLPHIRLVLVLREDEFDKYKMKELKGRFHDVELKLLETKPEEFVNLAQEFFRRRKERLRENAELDNVSKMFIEAAAQGNKAWMPTELDDLYKTVEKWKKK